MHIVVLVKTGKKIEKVEKNGKQFIVWTKEKPIKGKANEAVIGLLANYFQVSRISILLVKGNKNNKKIFNIINIK